jgi:hypothetical protein
VNAPLGLTPRNAPPKPGAIFCADGLGGFARPGHWLEFDASGGGLINLSTGDRMALPGAGGRQANGMMFGAPPSPTDVHVSLPIAGWLAGYRQPGQFLLDTLVQQQPVDFTQFKYRNMSGSNTFLVHDVRASELSSPPQVQMSSSVTEDKTQDLRVGIFLPYRTDQQADFNFEIASARVAWNAIMLWREYQAFKSGGTFMTSGSWASAVRLALGATYNWGPPGSEGADSDPPRDLRTARLSSQAPITHFAMSLKQFDWFTQHPKTIDHYKSFGRDGVTAGMIRDVVREQAQAGPNAQSPVEFDIPMIGKGLIHNARATTDPATAAALFWPDDIVLGFAQSPTMPPNGDVCTAVTFRLKNPTNGSPGSPPVGAPDGVPTNNGWRVRRVPVPLIGSGGDLMIIDISEKTVFTANDVGAYISGIS